MHIYINLAKSLGSTVAGDQHRPSNKTARTPTDKPVWGIINDAESHQKLGPSIFSPSCLIWTGLLATRFSRLRNSDRRDVFWRLFRTKSVMGRLWDDHFRDLGYPPKFYRGQDAGFDSGSSS